MSDLHIMVLVLAVIFILFLVGVYLNDKKKNAQGTGAPGLPLLVAIFSFGLFTLAIIIFLFFGILTDAALSPTATALFFGIKFFLPIFMIVTAVGLLSMRKWSYYFGLCILIIFGILKFKPLFSADVYLTGRNLILPLIWLLFFGYFIAIRQKFSKRQNTTQSIPSAI